MRPARPALLAIACLALLTPAASAQDLPDLPDLSGDVPAGATPSIEVVGEAALSARNDTARVTFGMEARRRTGPAALGASARKARGVIAKLRAAGVEARDIRTLTVHLTRFRRRGRVIYAVARNGVRVTVRDVRRTGALIDAAVAAGATGVGGPSFFVSDPKALYRRALLAAYDDAQAKAEELADRAGVLLGAPLRIREGTDVSSLEQEQSGAVPRSRTPTRPGNSRVAASVTVEFALEGF